MWYNRLSEYLLEECYQNNPICPCVFIKKSQLGFAIIAVYIDDLNIMGTPKELSKSIEYLKKEFEMKGLGKIKFFLGLANRAFSRLNFYSSIDIYIKDFKKILHGQSTPIEHSNGGLITRYEKGYLSTSRR